MEKFLENNFMKILLAIVGAVVGFFSFYLSMDCKITNLEKAVIRLETQVEFMNMNINDMRISIERIIIENQRNIQKKRISEFELTQKKIE